MLDWALYEVDAKVELNMQEIYKGKCLWEKMGKNHPRRGWERYYTNAIPTVNGERERKKGG